MPFDTAPSTIYRYNVSSNLLIHFTSNYDDDVSVDIRDAQHVSAPARVAIMKELQERTQPSIFSPGGAYDGKQSLFTSHRLQLRGDDSHTFEMPCRNGPSTSQVKVTLVAEINPA
ncbi:hypothetical protein BDV93DRAFT_507723 [Ceratobasidium sp. AG-I]|nr:hypothetical protein BDV93DRAFT_507723 [Ceratobasidium sp. AG-I]